MPTEIRSIPLESVVPSPYQTRKDFDEEGLKGLAETLKEHGLLNAIVVRKVGEKFELIAGERRVRAAKLLGWTAIEAKVQEVDDREAAEQVVVENLQRDDLNPIEQAEGYKRLKDLGLSLEEIAIKVGVGDKSTISRYLALLEMPQQIQDLLPRGNISEMHCRVLRRLAGRTDEIAFAQQADREGWSVKETERRVEKLLGKTKRKAKSSQLSDEDSPADPVQAEWEKIEAATKGWVWSVAYTANLAWRFDVDLEVMYPKDPKKTLGQWFLAMAQAFGEIKLDADVAQQLSSNDQGNQAYMNIVQQALKGIATMKNPPK